MAALGIILGIFVAMTVAATIDLNILHTQGAGIFPGIIAGVWTAWPFFHHAGADRYNVLHPVPKEYSLPVPHAFSKVRDLLADISYNFGDTWHIVTADTQTKRIVANLRFSDEVTKTEGDARGQLHTRTEREQRHLELEVQMKETAKDGSIIQLDFKPTIEGTNIAACDKVILSVCNGIEAAIGPGVDRGSPADKRLPPPPWWLISFTFLAVMVFWGSVSRHLDEVKQKISDHPKDIQQEKSDQELREQNMRREMDEWKKFKETYKIQ